MIPTNEKGTRGGIQLEGLSVQLFVGVFLKKGPAFYNFIPRALIPLISYC